MTRSVLFLAIALTVTAGCSDRKSTLSGTITLDGKPLEGGTVQANPVAKDGQTAAVAIGKDGRYKMPVSPTKLRVAVNSARKIGEKKSTASPDSMEDVFEEVVPPPFCDTYKSELVIDAAPGKETVLDIDLKSVPKKK